MKMTKEEKLAWLGSATDEEVVNSLRWAIAAENCGNIERQIEGQEDYKLITAEILRRMK